MGQNFNVGLKRRWNNLRRFRIIKENPKYDNPNSFELDDLSDEFEIDDNVDEGVLQQKSDDEKTEEQNLSLENEPKAEAKIDL